jgi:uncharacterized protein (DUF1778 family)
MSRTALLIRCEAKEADRIREEAQKEHRTISSYVLHVALSAVAADRMFSEFNRYRRSPTVSPRSAILVRCTVPEADQIREAARRRQMPINAFILALLKDAWISRQILSLSPMEAPRNPHNQSSRIN